MDNIKLKKWQLDVILKENPIDPELNPNAYWINNIYDILTFEEALYIFRQDLLKYDSASITPDWDYQSMRKALESGFITVYSSHPIKPGVFVTPSKLEAQSYGMSTDKPNKITVPTNYIAWLDVLEGQFTGEPPKNLQEDFVQGVASNFSIQDVFYWVNPQNNQVNALLKFNNCLLRLRAEILVIKDDQILLCNDNKKLFLPGGSLDIGEMPIDTAIRECQEEAFIDTSDVEWTNNDYVEIFDAKEPWVVENIPTEYQWQGYYNCLCIGNYLADYYGTVEKADLDHNINFTKAWYSIKDAIKLPGFKQQWLMVLKQYGIISDSNVFLEDTRNQLNTKSKNADLYRKNIKGKNRWERKKYSKIAPQVKSYNQINMNDFYKKDILTVTIPITGETSSYEVQVQLPGVVSEMAKNIKANGNIFEYRTVIQSLTKIFNTANIKVKCNCDDFKYRYAHQLIINNNSVDGSDKDPGPGKTGMANTQGKGCKHILLCLSNADWLMKTASVITNYTLYAQTNMKQAFDIIIFPKLYGVPISAAQSAGLVEDNTDLKTDKHTIETINEYAKNKGKILKGSNKNPAVGMGKIATKLDNNSAESNTNSDNKK